VPAWLTIAIEGSPLVHAGATPIIAVPLESVTTAASWMVSPMAYAVSSVGASVTLCARSAAEGTPGTGMPAELV
jgi:hypothetical protein